MNSEASVNATGLAGGNDATEVVEGRRGFVKKMTAVTLALGAGGVLAQTGRFLNPNVLYEPSRMFKVGALSQFPIGSRTVIDGRGVEIVRDKSGLHAISLVCTHLGCLVKPVANDPEIGYMCPCHGSNFAPRGEVLGGPAPTDLPWYEMYMDQAGVLVVDTAKVNHKRTKLVV